MRKLLLVLVIVGALVGYTASLDEVTKARCAEQANDLFDKWFGTSDGDFDIDGSYMYGGDFVGYVQKSRVVGGGDAFSARFADGGSLDGEHLIIGIDGYVQYPWVPQEVYDTAGFFVVENGEVDEDTSVTDAYFKLSIIALKGDEELLDIVEFKVVELIGNAEYSLEDFIGRVNRSGGAERVYQIRAYMPDGIDEEYYGLAISAISVEVEIFEGE